MKFFTRLFPYLLEFRLSIWRLIGRSSTFLDLLHISCLDPRPDCEGNPCEQSPLSKYFGCSLQPPLSGPSLFGDRWIACTPHIHIIIVNKLMKLLDSNFVFSSFSLKQIGHEHQFLTP